VNDDSAREMDGPPDTGLREFQRTLDTLSNPELLTAMDLCLLQLERRLYRYARAGHEFLDMADEGLVLAVRILARVSQTQSAAQHAQSHLQVVAVGEWHPEGIRPEWRNDPRVIENEDDSGVSG